MKKLVLLALVLILTIGCSQASNDPKNDASSGIRVVATVSPITSLVENIGGTRIALNGLIPEGTNSHTYEPSPSTVSLLSKADLIIANGLFLEVPTLKLAEANKQSDTVILRLGNTVLPKSEWVYDESFPEGGYPNPHMWTDPFYGIKYAEVIAQELSRMDPDNASYYEENLSNLKTRLQDLDDRITAAVETIPEDKRKLLTYHDSFPTFAPRYGFTTLGAIQPSDFTEPSAREVAQLIDQIKANSVPAIFGSEVFPSPILTQIAKESGAEFVDKLRDDDLPGKHGDKDHTYHGLIHYDVAVIVPALGGDSSSLEGFDTGLVFEGVSPAIYPE